MHTATVDCLLDYNVACATIFGGVMLLRQALTIEQGGIRPGEAFSPQPDGLTT